MRIFCATLALLLAGTAAFAEVNLYLYPRVDRGRNALVLSDLGRIDGDAETAQIGSIEIADGLFADGYIDRKELLDLVKGHVEGRVNIYGSGVRVSVVEAAAVPEEPRIVVRRGKAVRFQVVNSHVRVEQAGTALQDGAVGDEIPVKLKGQAVSRGRILNERVVELEL